MYKNHPLYPLSERYLSEKNVSVSTKRTYRFAYKHFMTYLVDHHIDIATTRDFLNYRDKKRASGYSSHWVYTQTCALKGLYRYLRIHQVRLTLPEAYRYDIMAPVKNERIHYRINKPILSLEEAKRLMIITRNDRRFIWDYRDHAIIYVMMTSGLSPYDVIHAKRADYQTKEGYCLLYLSKPDGTGVDYVKLSKGGQEALDDYLMKRKDSNPYLFISHKQSSQEGCLSRTFFKYMFPRILRKCGLADMGITPHCLRHTAAILNLMRGGSLEETRQFMRHATMESTVVYADYLARLSGDSERKIEEYILKEDAFDGWDDFVF